MDKETGRKTSAVTWGSRQEFYNDMDFTADVHKKSARLSTLLEMRDHIQSFIDAEFEESPILDEQLLVKKATENVTEEDKQEMRLHPDARYWDGTRWVGPITTKPENRTDGVYSAWPGLPRTDR